MTAQKPCRCGCAHDLPACTRDHLGCVQAVCSRGSRGSARSAQRRRGGHAAGPSCGARPAAPTRPRPPLGRAGRSGRSCPTRSSRSAATTRLSGRWRPAGTAGRQICSLGGWPGDQVMQFGSTTACPAASSTRQRHRRRSLTCGATVHLLHPFHARSPVLRAGFCRFTVAHTGHRAGDAATAERRQACDRDVQWIGAAAGGHCQINTAGTYMLPLLGTHELPPGTHSVQLHSTCTPYLKVAAVSSQLSFVAAGCCKRRVAVRDARPHRLRHGDRATAGRQPAGHGL